MNELKYKIKKISKQSVVERVFEKLLWSSRYIVLLGVLAGVVSAISLFIIGSLEVYHAVLGNLINNIPEAHEIILVKIIGAIDLFLIGIVFLLFSFGIYELFISKIDIARKNVIVSILEIHSLDELKSRMIKVILMVLIVSFFQKILFMDYETPLSMLYFAISILALSFGSYMLHKKVD